MYATPYKQNLMEYKALLCVSVLVGMTRERFFHAETVGAPIHESETEIKYFTEVNVVGRCDGSCREHHPGQVRKMMIVSEELRFAISHADGFRNAVQ